MGHSPVEELVSAGYLMGYRTWNNPIIDEQPGPPLKKVARGAAVGLLRASKNQNHMFSSAKKPVRF